MVGGPLLGWGAGLRDPVNGSGQSGQFWSGVKSQFNRKRGRHRISGAQQKIETIHVIVKEVSTHQESAVQRLASSAFNGIVGGTTLSGIGAAAGAFRGLLLGSRSLVGSGSSSSRVGAGACLFGHGGRGGSV
jgi:hypothetical protein